MLFIISRLCNKRVQKGLDKCHCKVDGTTLVPSIKSIRCFVASTSATNELISQGPVVRCAFNVMVPLPCGPEIGMVISALLEVLVYLKLQPAKNPSFNGCPSDSETAALSLAVATAC